MSGSTVLTGASPRPGAGTADLREKRLASAGLRSISAGLLAILLVATRVSAPYVILIALLMAISIDTRHVGCLKNYFLLYVLIVFCVGTAVLHLADGGVLADVACYLVAFLAGYALATVRHRSAPREAHRPAARSVKGKLRINRIEAALTVLVLLNLLFLAYQLMKYGIVGFYRGQQLLDQFLTYGKASATGGAEQIVRFVLKFAALGLIVLYVQACFELSVPIRYRYPVIVLVALPIVSLHRYDAILGGITVLGIYALDRRITDRLRVPSRVPRRLGSSPRDGGRGMTRTVAIGAAVGAAVVAALLIGLLRQGFQPGTSSVGALPILTSEIYPVQAYGEIKSNIDSLGHPHGKTIVLPLLLKLVPRAWYPDKPLNSGAYYMSVVRPKEFAAGYALPPTFFGDAYLNFGLAGALIGSLVLGMVAGRLDLVYRNMLLSRIPIFLQLFANFYSIMREPLSESLAGILLTIAVWRVAGSLVRARPTVRPRPGRQRLAATGVG